MSFFSSHSSKIEGDAPGLVALGVLLAAIVQALFYSFAAAVKIAPRESGPSIPVIPPAFNIKKVEISAEALEQADDYRAEPKTIDTLPEIVIPSERPVDDALPDEIRAAPAPSPLPNPFDTPRARAEERADLANAASEAAEKARRAVEERLRAQGDKLLDEGTKPDPDSRLLLDISDLASRKITEGMLKDLPGGGSLAVPPGYTSLDKALASPAPLRGGSAPILMPTDLLFEYNEYRLRPQAVQSLTKLGDLIRRNPQAAFIIEGHTDSEGSAEYNQVLSEQRAATVARWLVENMGVDPRQITTRGYGKTRLIVPGDRSREEQAINRRVEIIIRNR